MKERKSYGRHTLLPYRRALNRIWKITFLLAIVLAAAWWWGPWKDQRDGLFSIDLIMFAAAGIAFVLTIFFLLARHMAYVQPYQKYIKVASPFLRMNISYRRMQGVRPVLVQQIFPKDEIRRSQLNALEPYYGKTAVVLELRSFPVNESLLKLLLPSWMFTSQFKGLVLIVPDWMKLSTEIDTFRGTQRKSIKDREWIQDSHTWK
jgi:hypothetical protein